MFGWVWLDLIYLTLLGVVMFSVKPINVMTTILFILQVVMMERNRREGRYRKEDDKTQ